MLGYVHEQSVEWQGEDARDENLTDPLRLTGREREEMGRGGGGRLRGIEVHYTD